MLVSVISSLADTSWPAVRRSGRTAGCRHLRAGAASRSIVQERLYCTVYSALWYILHITAAEPGRLAVVLRGAAGVCPL